MNSEPFDIYKALSHEVFYQTEGVFYEPLFVFEEKISSLFRYYLLTHSVSRQFVVESETSLLIERARDKSPELIDLHFSITQADADYFDNFVFASILTQLFSAYEAYLLELIQILRQKISNQTPFSTENIPTINRYLKWMRDHGGCNLSLSKEANSLFDILREIRNRFVHGKVGDFPEQMRCRIDSLKESAHSKGMTENQFFILSGFRVVGESAKNVELAFLAVMDN